MTYVCLKFYKKSFTRNAQDLFVIIQFCIIAMSNQHGLATKTKLFLDKTLFLV